MVVSGGWVKNVVSYPYSGDLTGKMTAKAVLICRPNSHPFQERTLLLDQPVKIGRSVARARAAPNNAIFDCKVLSRNHALLWYENGKFYLQDTKSSNGTFVNNQRLSKGAEESPPREVCSGDIVQFGVDVMENARKVTHGCIVATLKLYLPDGKEAKASPSTSVVSSVGVVPLEDLYQLNQYLQEALQREQLLENKLSTLQHLVETTRQASDLGWKALIDEDRLLSRVEILENQLQVYSKNFAEDKLREELQKLQEDKNQYQGTAKESLRKLLQEKLDAVQKLNDLERTLNNTEDECAHLKELCDRSQQDLQDLAHKYCQQVQKVEELMSQIQETEDQHRETCEHLEQEKQELQARLQKQLESERALQIRLEALQADGDFTQKQLSALQSHLHRLQSNDDNIDKKLDCDTLRATDSTGTQVDIILERIEDIKEEEKLNSHDEIENLLCQLKISEEELTQAHSKVNHLHAKIEELPCRDDQSKEIIQLQERLQSLEMELTRVQAESNDTNMQVSNQLHSSLMSAPNQTNKLIAEITKLKEHILVLESFLEHYVCMVVILKELLSEARSRKKQSEQQLTQFQLELECIKIKIRKETEKANLLKQQLQAAENKVQEESKCASKIQEEVQSLEKITGGDKLQIHHLEESLLEEKQRSDKHADEAENLRKQLIEAQQCAKQSHNEAEQIRDRLRDMQQELETKQRMLLEISHSTDNRTLLNLEELQKNCESLQQENERLKLEYKDIKEENELLSKASCYIDALKEQLGEKLDKSFVNLLEQQSTVHTETLQMVKALEEELVILKERYAQCNAERFKLFHDLDCLHKDFVAIKNQSNSVPVLYYCIAFVLILIALSVAFIKFP
ncbi:sarcolemmal membrane-associated protein-like isoform X2 [Bacillus rossius redtenbacheri]|uniref:sarcolemmal membrane-associated protein-like isoform X2 n=1 Tax=Bacillus rossius redtenbacheri TaxID=93214 RepID=UPI002FDEBA8C